MGWNVPREGGAPPSAREGGEEEQSKEFQVVLGSPTRVSEGPTTSMVKETKNLGEGSPLQDRTKCLAGYASWDVCIIWRCGLKWGGGF